MIMRRMIVIAPCVLKQLQRACITLHQRICLGLGNIQLMLITDFIRGMMQKSHVSPRREQNAQKCYYLLRSVGWQRFVSKRNVTTQSKQLDDSGTKL